MAMVKVTKIQGASEAEVAAASLYSGLMAEALLRIYAIDHGTLNKTGLQSPFVVEFCYLQLRKIAEIMAIGCLVAHGDIKEAASLHGEWNADKIIKRLSGLGGDFFPAPVTLGNGPDGYVKSFTRLATGLTKEEMLQIYYECDRYMHAGTLKKLLKPKNPLRVNYPDITAKAQKFRSLIESHTVLISGGERVFVCYRKPGSNLGEVEVAIGERLLGPPPKSEAAGGKNP
jgi:hypothetical protein